MTPLQELLNQRDTTDPSELMQQLREGLSHTPAASGPGSANHQLLLAYFKLNERACEVSFACAPCKGGAFLWV